MILIGLLNEGKTPPDTRVALSPAQCAQIMHEQPNIKIIAAPSPHRCFSDQEYSAAGVALNADLTNCDLLLGIKEVKIKDLIPDKKYLFFSHTKKAQPYNQQLMQAMIAQRITLIDYECLTHADEQRILGFGFFAGLVGAHNGLLTYGAKTGAFLLPAAHDLGSVAALKNVYDDLVLPPVRIVVTGSGKVAAGVLEVMQMLDIEYVEPQDFLTSEYAYPVYTHLKGNTLFVPKDGGAYHRADFHHHPENYHCLFTPFLTSADILMNGIYWDKKMPRLFEKNELQQPGFRLNVIADITCDPDGSIPINSGASTIADPVYAVNRMTLAPTDPFQQNPDTIDIMAVDNLPNELPRDASAHFGTHIEKYILHELLAAESDIIQRATICSNGALTPHYDYLHNYAFGPITGH